jgi:predicted negative regulator of RcsB-dependent stress response
MPIISLLLANWKWVLLGLLVAAVGYLNWRLESVKQARHKDAVSYEAKIVTLQGSLQAQNEAIAQLGRESADRKAKASKALQEASRAAQSARSEAERLRGLASVPRSPEGSQCAAADAVAEIRKGLSK